MPKYTSRGIVYSLALHRSAERDLEQLEAVDPDARDELYALLQEIRGSQALLESLTVRDFGLPGSERFNVQPWQAQQQRGRNLWRLKCWDLENLGLRYRVIYALDPRVSRYYVLAVLPRSLAYDEQHPRVRELLAVYDRLGIPHY